MWVNVFFPLRRASTVFTNCRSPTVMSSRCCRVRLNSHTDITVIRKKSDSDDRLSSQARSVTRRAVSLTRTHEGRPRLSLRRRGRRRRWVRSPSSKQLRRAALVPQAAYHEDARGGEAHVSLCRAELLCWSPSIIVLRVNGQCCRFATPSTARVWDLNDGLLLGSWVSWRARFSCRQRECVSCVSPVEDPPTRAC